MRKKRKCDLSALLQETPETYYWVGFILADGHINKRKELKVCLSEKDYKHLLKLKKILNIENVFARTTNLGYKYVSITAMHADVISQFKKKFDIKHNKTKVPPKNLNTFTKNRDLFFSLIIGFIDGDGSIQKQTNRKDCALTVKCHKSWIKNLKLFNDFIYSEFLHLNKPKPIINNNGYARFVITNSIVLKFLKNKAIKLSLPILKRKWDIIDLNFVGKLEYAKTNLNNILELLDLRMSNKQISKKLNISPALVTKIANNNNYKKIGNGKGYIKFT